MFLILQTNFTTWGFSFPVFKLLKIQTKQEKVKRGVDIRVGGDEESKNAIADDGHASAVAVHELSAVGR